MAAAPDAVLVSGDLVTHAGAREYERVRELLAPLPMPVYVLAGNHDDPDALREYFVVAGSSGAPGEPFQYAVDVGELRLIACDTRRPGFDSGEFGPERRSWLETQLEAQPLAPTVVAMHHPPLRTGNRAFDSIGLAEADRSALAKLLPQFDGVRRVVGGHFHRTIFDTLGGCGVFACASTHLQAPLEIGEGVIRIDRGKIPAIAVHAWLGADLVTHVEPIELDRSPLV
jgi:3',5'-cyclic-AMP phosphodiesterase